MTPRTKGLAKTATLVLALASASTLAQSPIRPLLRAPNDEDAFALQSRARDVGALVDADGDGDLDFLNDTHDEILGNVDSTTLSVSRVLPPILAATPGSSRLAFGDFDRDGHVDLVRGGIEIVFGPLLVPNPRRRVVDVLSLQTVVIAGPVRPEELRAIDLDADGDLDLLATDKPAGIPLAPSDVYVYLNDGSGNFSGRQTITSQVIGVPRIRAIQIDGTGPTELVEQIPGSGLSVLSRNADGSYARSPLSLPLNPSEAVEDLAVADMDADGAEDLILRTSRNSESRLLVLRNTDAAFTTLLTDPAPTTIRGSIRLVDIDGDGIVDLSIQSQTGIESYRNDGSGNVSQTQSISTSTTFANTLLGDRLFGDIDGDGRSDFINRDGPNVVVGFGQPDGTYSEPRDRFFDRRPGFFAGVVRAGDFNGDGRQDLASVSGGTSATLGLSRGTGDYVESVVSGPLVGNEITVVTDLDGDDMDELVAFDADGRFSLIDDQGITSPGAVSGRLPIAAQAIDVDGDGDDELLVLSSMRSVFVLVPDPTTGLALNPTAVPGPSFPSALTALPTQVAVFDADGDGDDDALVTAEAAGPGLVAGYLLINNAGVLTLGPSLPIMGLGGAPSASTFLGTPAIGDFDGDSDLDLAFPGLRTQLLNDGTGNFSIGELAIPTPASEVYLATDLTQDGVSDLVAWSSQNGGSVLVLENDGSGGFTTGTSAAIPLDRFVSAAAGENPREEFLLTDLDDDGDEDLVAGASVLLASATQLELRAPLRLGNPTRWIYQGSQRPIPGMQVSAVSLASLAVSTNPRPQALPLGIGSLALDAPIPIASSAATPGLFGRFQTDLTVPSLPSLQGIVIHSQVLAIYRELGGPGMTTAASNAIRSVITF